MSVADAKILVTVAVDPDVLSEYPMENRTERRILLDANCMLMTATFEIPSTTHGVSAEAAALIPPAR